MNGVLVPLRATRSESVSSKILLILHNLRNLKLSFVIICKLTKKEGINKQS